MTTFTGGTVAFDMTNFDFSYFTDGTITSFNSTTVVVDLGGGRIDTFTGLFSDFDSAGVPATGSITSIQRTQSGAHVFTFSDFEIGIHDFAGYVTEGRTDDLLAWSLMVNTNTLFGGTLNDHLVGYGSENLFRGGTGNDILEGNIGFDTADYSDATSGVTVNLTLTTAQAVGGTRGSDTLISIDRLIGSPFNDSLIGNSQNNYFTPLGGNDSVNGGTGLDRVIYAAATSSVTVNLGLTTAQAIGGGQGTDTLTSIEDAVGGNFNDTLTGGATDNVLQGLAGNDTLSGGNSNDTLVGGAGNDGLNGGTGIDTASYEFATGGVTVDLSLAAQQAVGGGEGADTLTSIENLTGSNYEDTLLGNSGDNVLLGRGADDFLVGGPGNDTFNGDSGYDTVSYAAATGPISVNVETFPPAPQAVGADQGSDLFLNIESVIGSAFDDTLIGFVGDLQGGAGNDFLRGSNLRNDFDGGSGIDTVSYDSIFAGHITARLYLGVSSKDDTFTGVENLTGTGGDDALGGEGGVNVLTGLGGQDTLEGRGGDDVLDGGAGYDRVDYTNAVAGVTVNLQLTTQSVHASEGTDTFISIEGAIGSQFADGLNGTEQRDLFYGGGGNDVVQGLGGDDNLVGDAGEDTLAGGEGADFLLGGDGADLLFGGPGIDQFLGGLGNDILYIVGNDSLIVGDEDYDQAIVLSATGVNIVVQSVEYVAGNSGNDVLSAAGTNTAIVIGGAGGDDVLTGGSGNDTLAGMDNDDVVNGGGGADQLFAGTGSDDFFGGDGDDLIYILGNDDVIQGDAGYDQAIILDTAGVSITIEATTEYCAGNSGNDVINASALSTAVTLGGAGGDDVVTGGSAGDTMSGSSGFDTLYGNGGADVIFGGDDNDALYGGAGNDQLFGGNGADVIFIQDTSGTDSISGFVDGVDLFDFSLHTGVTDFSQLTISTLGGDALVDFIGGQLFIAGAAGLIEASDFVFA